MRTPLRTDEAGYFVVIDVRGEEIQGTRREVPGGTDPELDSRIVFALAMAMGDDCEVVFNAAELPAKRQRLGVRYDTNKDERA